MGQGEAVAPLPVVPGQQLVGERLLQGVALRAGVLDRLHVADGGLVGVTDRPGPFGGGQRVIGPEVVGVELGEGLHLQEDVVDLAQVLSLPAVVVVVADGEPGGGDGIVHPEEVVDEEDPGRAGVERGLGPDTVPVGGGVVAEQRLDPDELHQRLAHVGDVALLLVLVDDGLGVEGFGVGGPGLDGHEPTQGGRPDAGLPFLERCKVAAEVDPSLATLQRRRTVAPGDEGGHVHRDQGVVDELEVADAEAQGGNGIEAVFADREGLLQRHGQAPDHACPAAEERIAEPFGHDQRRLAVPDGRLEVALQDTDHTEETEGDRHVGREARSEGVLDILADEERHLSGLGPVGADQRPPEEAAGQHGLGVPLVEAFQSVDHRGVEQPGEE